MPLIPKDKDSKRVHCPWLAKRNGLGKTLGEGIQGKQLHAAKALLGTAIHSGQMEHASAAVESLLKLPENDKAKALDHINTLLGACSSGEPHELEQLRTMGFILMNLQNDGWAMLDPWEQTQPHLDGHSSLLANSLFMGNANGTDIIMLETLGFLANCGAHAYDGSTLRYILQRQMKRAEAATGFYNLTGILAMKGPEELRAVAEEMEAARIGRCIGKLEYGDDRQFEGSAELMLLVMTGRSHLAPQLEVVRDEMLSLMAEPGVYVEGADEDDEAREEERQQKRVVRDKAASILGQLGSIGMPLVLETDGSDADALKSAAKVFGLLAARDVSLHLLIHDGDPEAVRQTLADVPESRIHLDSEEDARGAEAASLMQIVLSPPGESEEVGLANHAEAASRLREMQAEGLALEIGLDCPEGHAPEEQAVHLAGILAMLEQNGLEVSIRLSGANAERVAQMMGQPSTE